ncbi:hypothetical protein ABT236_32610 [Streptomyces sp. NPDC001523]|uniref:hypothetical protein n=1 Tax=Streptomyces sp. NPDC001523 TaxID=3154383 RepID=UPI003326474A
MLDRIGDQLADDLLRHLYQDVEAQVTEAGSDERPHVADPAGIDSRDWAADRALDFEGALHQAVRRADTARRRLRCRCGLVRRDRLRHGPHLSE